MIGKTQIADVAGKWVIMPLQVLADRGLTPSAKLVYCAIMSHARIPTGKTCAWPSIARIAEVAGIGRTAVNEGIAQLKERGLLEVEGRAKHDGGRATNLYKLVILTGLLQESGHEPRVAAGIRPCPQPESGLDPSRNPATEVDHVEVDNYRRPASLTPQCVNLTRTLDDGGSEGPPDEHTGLRRKPKREAPRLVTEGRAIVEGWRSFLEPLGIPPPTLCTPAALVLASKCYRALGPGELTISGMFTKLVQEVKKGARPRFASLFLEREVPGRKLASCLAGDWTYWRDEEKKPESELKAGDRW